MKYIIEDETLKAIVDRICTAIERVTETTYKSENSRDEISAARSTISELLRNLPEVANVMSAMKSKEDKDNENENNEDENND